MRKLRNLLAAIAVSAIALMPLSNTAQAQLVYYHHGHRVKVTRAVKNRWSDIKSGVRYNSDKLTHGGKTSLAEQRQDARREALYRAKMENQR